MQHGDQSDILDFLKNAPVDVGNAGEVRIIQTHISIIVLKGDKAFKLKRAIVLPYADFSTAALRAATCEQEVILNRRTAPTLYLGTRRITRENDGQLAFDGQGELVDAVVEMRRFDEDTLFSRLAAAGRLDRPLLTALARNIAEFHAQAEIIRTDAGADPIAAVLTLNEQCTAMEPVLGVAATQGLRAALRSRLKTHRKLLDSRARAGRIRRCHGDLHLRNLCLVDGQPTLFDCIEFSDAFANIDVLYDLAFLLMDLLRANLPAEANLVMNRYMDECDEADGLALLPFFMALRASIRAQVLATQAELPDTQDRSAVGSEARAYLKLAMGLLQPVPLRLVAVGGLSGSGKSTVAAAIAHRIAAAPGARILATDRIRKRMAGVPAESPLPAGHYTQEASDRVYATMAEHASATLAGGWSVIADAVFARPEERLRIARCAAETSLPFHGIWLEAAPDALIARVEARRNDASDAGVDVVRAQLKKHGPAVEWTIVPAGGTPADTAAAVAALLEEAELPASGMSDTPPWEDAPDGWNWVAQDEDGRWFWYAVQPQAGMEGGVWRSPRRAQQFAAQGEPNPEWHASCRQRPCAVHADGDGPPVN
ncbi:MAG: AAA family ATPase [Burkholderiaceae bacterium]